MSTNRGIGSFVEEAVGRGHEAERRRDDLVAVADPERADHHVQTGRPAAAGHAEPAAGHLGDLRLERGREWTEGQHAAAENLFDELTLARPDRWTREWASGDWIRSSLPF